MTGKDPLELHARGTSLSPSQLLHKKFHLLLGQMLEQESSNRPQNIQEVRARLQDLQRGKGWFVYPYVLGFLVGIAPYALFVISPYFAPVFYPLLFPLYCVWPFLCAGQLIAATVMLFQSRKRLVGLGILTGLALFVLALLLRQEPLSFLLNWPSLGD